MKTVIYLLGSLILSAFLITSSCSKVEELTDVDFEATYDAELEVETTSRGMDGDFSSFATIDPTSNSNFNKYINNIKNIEIITVLGEVLYISEDISLTADLKIYSETYSAKWSLNNFPVTVGTV